MFPCCSFFFNWHFLAATISFIVSLFRLEEFKKLNPPGNLERDSELLMTIRGDTLLYKNAAGNIGTIHSEVFTRAMCDVYYGKDPVSPAAKQSVIDTIKKL